MPTDGRPETLSDDGLHEPSDHDGDAQEVQALPFLLGHREGRQ